MKAQHATTRIGAISAGSSETATFHVKAPRIDAIHLAARNSAGEVIDRQLYRVSVKDTNSKTIPRTGNAISADAICPSAQASNPALSMIDLAGAGDVDVTIYADVAIESCDITLISF